MSHEGKPPKYIPALDGIRGFGILLVLQVHFSLGFVATTDWESFVLRLIRSGWWALDLFFVMSGFLITRILLHGRGRPNWLLFFYARRVLRIFPLYYGALFCALILGPMFLEPTPSGLVRLAEDQWFMWAFLPNFLVIKWNDYLPYFHPMWSLGVEEQFYVVWALVVAAIGSRRILQALCVAAFAFSIGYRLYLQTVDTSPLVIYVMTFCRLDALSLGCFLALLEIKGRLPAMQSIGLPIFAMFAIPSFCLTIQESSWYDKQVQSFGFSLIAITSTGFILSTCRPQHLANRGDRFLQRLVTLKPLQFLGTISYGVYIFHWPLRVLFDQYVPFYWVRSQGLVGFTWYSLVLTSASIVLATLSWYGMERRILRLKKYLLS